MLRKLVDIWRLKFGYSYIFEEGKCGFMVYAKEFPYVTVVADTKKEALKLLKEDLSEINQLKRQESPKREYAKSNSRVVNA